MASATASGALVVAVVIGTPSQRRGARWRRGIGTRDAGCKNREQRRPFGCDQYGVHPASVLAVSGAVAPAESLARAEPDRTESAATVARFDRGGSPARGVPLRRQSTFELGQTAEELHR